MNRNAIITFDYEVFLGRKTGSIEKCVIKPTNSILDILKLNQARAIFFVDAAWLLFLKENFDHDFQTVALQLRDIVDSGSSVELHLHPQWLDAIKSDKNISFSSYKNYSLHSLSYDEVINLFNRGIELLQSITGKKINSFRAGGWCVEPFQTLVDAFKMNNIRYDFSVVPGTVLSEGEVYDYDFTNVPQLPFYRFKDSVNESDPEGNFMEVPLSTYSNNPAYRIINKGLLKLMGDKISGDGIGIKENSKYSIISQLLRLSKGMLTLDKTSSIVFKYLIVTHFRASSLLVVVSHPKAVSAESLRNLRYITRRFNTLGSSDLDKVLLN